MGKEDHHSRIVFYAPKKIKEDITEICREKYGLTVSSFMKQKLREIIIEETKNWSPLKEQQYNGIQVRKK